jgi:chemotaxis signal transduction protein
MSAAEMATAAQLRREFDSAFALPPAEKLQHTEALLVVHVTSDWKAALRITELGGVYQCPAIQPLRGSAAAQIGLVGLRGKVTVVFSLAAVLGRKSAASADRWIALAASDRTSGFLFHGLDGYARVESARIRRSDAAMGAGTTSFEELVELDGATLPVVNVAALIASIRDKRVED